MTDARAECDAILEKYDAGELSAQVALMQMLIAAEDDVVVAALLRSRARGASARFAEIMRLYEENAAGCARIAAMLKSDHDSPDAHASIEDGIAFTKRLFDWSVEQSEEASVALYSLGNADVLRAATNEIASLFETWGVLGASVRALDIGCGIGRMEHALAPRVASIHGIDVSPKMIDAARRRCAAIPNAVFSVCTGFDLAEHRDDAFDLVFAVDSFPYLVQSGDALVEAHFAEAARVLRAGGDFVVLNFSYRGDAARDADDVETLARARAFEIVTLGARPFQLWDGVGFHLRRRA